MLRTIEKPLQRRLVAAAGSRKSGWALLNSGFHPGFVQPRAFHATPVSHSVTLGGKEDDRDFHALLPAYEHYPQQFQPTHSLHSFHSDFSHLEKGQRLEDTTVRVAGRILSKRKASSKLVFLDIESNGERLQVMATRGRYWGSSGARTEQSEDEFRQCMKTLRRGDIIGLHGYPGVTGVGELSLIPTHIQLLAPCLRMLPPSHKGLLHNDLRYRYRYLDYVLHPDARKAVTVRSTVLKAMRRFFEDKGFLEVETPILYSSAGGALARPFTTSSNALNCDFSLRIAPELFLKELVIGGFERVFEIGKVFRNEGIDAFHNPEFSSCEFYQAYGNLEELMDTTEALLHSLATAVNGQSTLNLSQKSSWHKAPVSSDITVDLQGPYQRIDIIPELERCLGHSFPHPNDEASIPELLSIAKQHDVEVERPFTLARVLDAFISHFIEPKCIQPTFVCGHPVAMSPLAKIDPQRPGITRRFELFIAGREVCNAYEELNDPDEQLSRFSQQNKDRTSGDSEAHEMDASFVEALEYGLPPTAGWGMGIDRVLMLLSGSDHIKEVLSFPVVRHIEKPDDLPTSEEEEDHGEATKAE